MARLCFCLACILVLSSLSVGDGFRMKHKRADSKDGSLVQEERGGKDQKEATLLTQEATFLTRRRRSGGIDMITCPFLAALADHLDMTSTDDFDITAEELQAWSEKFGLPSQVAFGITTPIRQLGGKIDLRQLPENGISHMRSTAIRSPLNARVGPNRSQYERWLSHVKEDEHGCISTANLGQAISKVTEVRIPMALTSKDPTIGFLTWTAAILSFSDRLFGKICTKVDVIKSLFLDAKFPKSPDQVQPYSLEEVMSGVAEMMGSSLAEVPLSPSLLESATAEEEGEAMVSVAIEGKTLTQLMTTATGMITSLYSSFSESPPDYEYAFDSLNTQGWKMVKILVPKEKQSDRKFRNANRAWREAFSDAGYLVEDLVNGAKGGEVAIILDSVRATVSKALRTCSKAFPDSSKEFNAFEQLFDNIIGSGTDFAKAVGWLDVSSLIQEGAAQKKPNFKQLLTTGVGILTALISAFTEDPPDYEFAIDSLNVQGWKMVKLLVPTEEHRSDKMRNGKRAWDRVMWDANDILEDALEAKRSGYMGKVIEVLLTVIDTALNTAADILTAQRTLLQALAELINGLGGSILDFSLEMGWVADPSSSLIATNKLEAQTKSSYLPIDEMKPDFQCGTEYYFSGEGSLADVVDGAHSWCNSDLVPEEKRVPEFLRGLYWMKDLELPDVAFCPSLGEWDAETRSVRLAVWTHFVFRKTKEEEVPGLAKTVAKLPWPLSKPLIYTIEFTDDTFTNAKIYTNSRLANAFIKFPLEEMSKTEDGSVVSKKKGDIWNRPSFFGFGVFTDWFKFEQKGGRYYAVRVMDDDGTVHPDRYKMMKQAETAQTKAGGSFVRYAAEC